MSQEEFADLLGMSKSAYGRLEKKETSVELDRLIQFSNTLNVPMNELLPDTLSVTNTSSGQGAINYGTINTYNIYSKDEALVKFAKENEELRQTISELQAALAKSSEKHA